MNTQPRHPKCRALPVEPHPDIQFLPLYHVEEDNQSFSCPRPFLWANSFLHRTRQPAEIPQTQTPQGFPAVRLTQFRILPRCSQAQPSLDRSAHDSENTPPACGRRIYYTSFFSGLQGKNVSPAHSPRAAFSASTRSVFSQATPRSSRPMWP